MRIIVSAGSSLQYYGHYLAGIESTVGPVDVTFASQDLPAIRSTRDGMALVLADGTRLFLDADDHAGIDTAALEWCDAYGKVNLLPHDLETPIAHKLVPLGPSFGLRWTSWHSAARLALAASRTDGSTVPAHSRLVALARHFSRRRPLSDYRPGTSDPSRMFFLATYWHQHPEANTERQTIWDAIVADGRWHTTGGFVGAPDAVPEALRSNGRLRVQEYLEQTRRSLAAINTPAVHGCLGWKLGEFLALGKAIVTLPIAQVMPGAFDLERHVAVVERADDVIDTLARLSADHVERSRLETSARRYFLEEVAPDAAMARLVSVARQQPRGSDRMRP